MSAYYSSPPPQGPPYGSQPPYPQAGPPYPEQSPCQPGPQSQQWNTPPPQQQGYYGPPPPQQQQQQQWDPQRIWAEANSPPAQHATPANGARSGSPFVTGSRSGSPFVGGMDQQQQGQDGERGIGATVLGGGAGAFLGHEMGHGKLATIGGLVAGAIAANAFEHHEKKKHREREEAQAYDHGYLNGERRELSGSRSRGVDDDSYYERESTTYDDEYAPHHHHHHHHHHDRDYDEEDYQVERYSRRDDDDYRRKDDYYERDGYVERDDYRRRDDY